MGNIFSEVCCGQPNFKSYHPTTEDSTHRNVEEDEKRKQLLSKRWSQFQSAQSPAANPLIFSQYDSGRQVNEEVTEKKMQENQRKESGSRKTFTPRNQRLDFLPSQLPQKVFQDKEFEFMKEVADEYSSDSDESYVEKAQSNLKNETYSKQYQLMMKRAQLGYAKRQKEMLKLQQYENCGFPKKGNAFKKCQSENILTDLLSEIEQEEANKPIEVDGHQFEKAEADANRAAMEQEHNEAMEAENSKYENMKNNKKFHKEYRDDDSFLHSFLSPIDEEHTHRKLHLSDDDAHSRIEGKDSFFYEDFSFVADAENAPAPQINKSLSEIRPLNRMKQISQENIDDSPTRIPSHQRKPSLSKQNVLNFGPSNELSQDLPLNRQRSHTLAVQ